ncbi:UPF0255 protein [Colletotrichum truncatum]|uniref:UPF0255 protein n=1 Tax=Colletotrichum truncatum TaxID=5467 RepID=A0ACC3YDX5_COLTU|nr:UPF0255 protein [Colletotrichum truncatum]KAF6790272.1 UPF0255 protein [Colletotrichum truncatum]
MSQLAQYHVQASVDNPISHEHHRSISALWEKKWKPSAQLGIYPFMDGKIEDFEPLFDKLIKENGDDCAALFNPDKYAKHFLPVAESLISQAKSLEEVGKTTEARDLFLRAGAVCRLARFPINRVDYPLCDKAWQLNKAAYMAASPYLETPNEEVFIPHVHASEVAGESKSSTIPVYVRVPKGESPKSGWPVILYICGLDAYRTELTELVTMWNRLGYACVSAEVPGTGDCPAARSDPTSPDRLWSSVLDWMEKVKSERGFDTSRIVVHGLSTGGYYAIRIAHTHADRLLAVAAHGGGCHHMFDPAWLRAVNHMEYPFALAEAMAYKFGYETVEDFVEVAQGRFSLLENKILDMPSTHLLLTNGVEDSIFPIEDCVLPLKHGNPKVARLIEGREHMGSPEADAVVVEWIRRLVGK